MIKQGTHCTGKTGKMATTKIPVREFGNLAKTQGIRLAQVVNFMILKVKIFQCFAVKISEKILKLDKSAKSVLCMK